MHQFYQDASCQAEINRWLTAAQVSPQAWQFCWPLMAKDKVPVNCETYFSTSLLPHCVSLNLVLLVLGCAMGRLRLSYANNLDNLSANRTFKITCSCDPSWHQSPRPLPKAIAVWRAFTRVTPSLAVTANRERRPLAPLHKKLIKHYTTQSFKYGLKSPHSMNYNYNLKPRRWTSQFTH